MSKPSLGLRGEGLGFSASTSKPGVHKGFRVWFKLHHRTVSRVHKGFRVDSLAPDLFCRNTH